MDWLNDVGSAVHDGWMWFDAGRVAATAAAVGTVVAIPVAWAAVRTWGQTRRDSKAKSRPMVAAELRAIPYTHGSQSLVIKNYGPSIAKNVRVTFDPPIPMPENTDGIAMPIMLRRFAKTIPQMMPGVEIDNLYYAAKPGPAGKLINGEPTPDEVTVRIEYESEDGDRYSADFPLDVELLRARTFIVSSTSPDSQRKESLAQLKQVTAALKDLAKSGRLMTKEEREREYAGLVAQDEKLEALWNTQASGGPLEPEQASEAPSS